MKWCRRRTGQRWRKKEEEEQEWERNEGRTADALINSLPKPLAARALRLPQYGDEVNIQ